MHIRALFNILIHKLLHSDNFFLKNPNQAYYVIHIITTYSNIMYASISTLFRGFYQFVYNIVQEIKKEIMCFYILLVEQLTDFDIYRIHERKCNVRYFRYCTANTRLNIYFLFLT